MSDLSNLVYFPPISGPLTSGHYIQIGMGFGFYVPEHDFQRVQDLADRTHKVQFLGVTRAGASLCGTRDEILDHPDSAGLVAWIVPQDSRPGLAEQQVQERLRIGNTPTCEDCGQPQDACACEELETSQ